jgi:hypothetical protein
VGRAAIAGALSTLLACDNPRFAGRPSSSVPTDAAESSSLESRRSAVSPAADAPDSASGAGRDASAELVPSDLRPDALGAGVARDTATRESLPTPEPMGGAWVTCYGNYKPQSTPERDVTRLGLLCGPANGMREVGATTSGDASDVPASQNFVVRAGECFRIFAVAEPTVADLAIEVRDPRGLPVASDHNSDRFPIVNPDGPFCLFEAGTYSLRVHARKGRGKYALQLWRLP